MAYGEVGIPPCTVPPNAYVIYDVEVLAAAQSSSAAPTGPSELLRTSDKSTRGLALIAEEGLGLEEDQLARAVKSLTFSVS
jgi:hypothetical protein